MPINRILGAAAITAAIAGGAVVGALLGVPAVTAAQEGGGATTTEPGLEASPDGADAGETGDDARFCGPGRRGAHRFFAAHSGVVADALGISEDELVDALRDGDTLAQLAEANDVEVQDVIDSLVAKATEALAGAVTDGNLDEERAEEIEAGLAERIAAHVNGEHPLSGGGPGHEPGFGPGAHPDGPTS